MDRDFLLIAAVCAMIPVGIAIGICFFFYAWFYAQSIRGKNVETKIRNVRRIIFVLFAVFIGIFAVIEYALSR